MNPAQHRLPTFVHRTSRHNGRLPARIALTAMLAALLSVGNASAMGFGGGFRGNFGQTHAFGRNAFTSPRTIRPPAATRLNNSSNRVVTGGGKDIKGSKVVDHGDHRGAEMRNPRPPGHARKPIHPVIIAVPSGARAVTDSGPSGTGGRPNASHQTARRGGSGVPTASERRYVPDEVVLELAAGISEQAAATVARRHRLVRLESFDFRLGGTRLVRCRIPDRRVVPGVVRALEADRIVLSAQPNYLASLQEDAAAPRTVGVGDPAQYALAKLQLPQAHTLALGDKVLIAVVDSGIDVAHPELAGMIADQFDAIGSGDKVHPHGTGIAGAIVAHARLTGSAPAARILAARAFGARRDTNDGTTFNILKALDWSVTRGARIINMSFAGPRDPAVLRSLAVARGHGVVLVAAAGNAGPKSPPLYPAADPDVIAVTATDENDLLFAAANQGKHIAVAAPGVDIFLPATEGTYQMVSGTSFAAAEVSGTVALLLERRPDLDSDGVRNALVTTAHDLGAAGVDSQFGAGLVDAYRAILSIEPPPTGTAGGTPPLTASK
jgi:subtilisin family serine protease